MNYKIEDLNEFLFDANIHGYGGDGKEVVPDRPGFIELDYIKEDWHFHDSYAGHYFAPGQEVVYYKDKPVWAMAYAGGMKFEYHGDEETTHKVFVFLKKALIAMDSSKPFRGPEKLEEGDLSYISKVTGGTRDFIGNEKIYCDGKLLFEQNFIGGIIVGK